MADCISIWLIRVGEVLPTDCDGQRLLRMGLLAEELLKRDVTITWWASSFDHNRKIFRENVPNVTTVLPNYQIRFLHGCGYKKNLSLKRIYHYFLEKREFLRVAKQVTKPDIIVAAMPNIDLANAAVQFGLRNSIPVFIDVRDMWPELYEDYFSKLKPIVHGIIIPFKLQLSWTLSRATGIIATSEKFLEWALGYAKRRREENDRYFYVSYPEVDIQLHDEDFKYWYDMGLSNNHFICCFFGQFGHAVDLETVLRAAKILDKKEPNIKFVICGLGEKLTVYQEITKGLNNVFYPGWVNRRQICSLGKISQVGLLAYKENKNYEWSMPNKFCEYLALGLACIVKPKGMMEKLVYENHCGLRYESEQELAEQLLKLSGDLEKVEEMRKRARQLYKTSFCAEKVYGQYADYILEQARKGTGERIVF